MSRPDDDASARLSPVDHVPDPGATIPFRRSMAVEPDDVPQAPSTAGTPRRSASQRNLHLPSLVLGFSAGVLLSAALCAFAFALFVALG
jgi:hypothetical protein